MPDLDFALDGLYAAGWWPDDGDRCVQNADGRWYPGESMIIESFEWSVASPRIETNPQSLAVEIVWSSINRGRQSVHGRSRGEALLLAFTNLYLESLARSTSY